MGQSIEVVRAKYNNGHYQDQLERGLRFQDLVTRHLYQRGIIVVGYASRYYQQKYGENYLKAEIKFDSRCRQRGKLWLEVAEKSHPDRDSYTQSGICRLDSLFYVIGDAEGVWMFVTKHLRALVKTGKLPDRIETATSIAHLMPFEMAHRYAISYVPLVSESF